MPFFKNDAISGLRAHIIHHFDRIKESFGATSDRQVSGAAAQIYAVRLSGTALAFGVQVGLAQFLGAAQYGVFTLVWVSATLLGQLAATGFNETASRFLPTYIARGAMAHARGFVWFAQNFTLLVAITLSFLVMAGLFFFRIDIPEIYFWPCVIGMLCVPLTTWTHVLEFISISRSWTLSGLVPTYLARPILLLASLLVLWLMTGSRSLNAMDAVWALFLACALAALLQAALVQPALLRELGDGQRRLAPHLWITSSAPLLLSQGFLILATNVDVLMLSVFTTPENVGIYFAAAKSVAIISFINIAVGVAITRRFAESLATEQPAALARQFQRAKKWMLWPSLVFGTLLMLTSPLFLQIFGPDFSAGASLVWILMFGVFLQAAAGPVQEMMIVSGRQNDVAITAFLSMLLNIVLNIALVLSIGLIGAAIASVLATAFRILSLRYLCFQKYKLLTSDDDGEMITSR